MSRPADTVPVVRESGAPSQYADQMPKLRAFASLPAEDRQRRVLREELILAFMPVVEHLAIKHGSTRSAVEDLTQVGMVGLITAIDRWNPDLARGEFLGYLIPCVRGEMLRWFRDRTWSMRVPRALKDLSVAIGRISGPLSAELGRAPRPSELAARLEALGRASQPPRRHPGRGRSPVGCAVGRTPRRTRQRPGKARRPPYPAAAAGRATGAGPRHPHHAVLR